VLLVLVRITLPFTLPYVLNKLAARYGLSLTYERMDRSFTGGYAEIWHLVIAPEEGGEPFAHFEYMEADLVVSSLLFGQVEFRRLEVDGADLFINREEDGRLRLFKRDLAIEGSKPPEPRPTTKPIAEDKKPAEVDLRPPVIIEALRLQHVHARVRDRSISPPLDTRVVFHLRLSDLGSELRPARFEVDLESPDFLDTFHAEGLASTTKESLAITFEAALHGLHLGPLAGYLAPFGLRPAADDISFRTHGTVAAKAAATPGTVEASVRIENTAVTADGETAFALDEFALDAPSVGLHATHVKEIRIAGARAMARITSAGHPLAGGIEVVGGGRP
jgi:hypothetical protein